jgi:hypothetical protein
MNPKLVLILSRGVKINKRSSVYKNVLKSTLPANTIKPKKACCSSCKSGKKCESEKDHHH